LETHCGPPWHRHRLQVLFVTSCSFLGGARAQHNAAKGGPHAVYSQDASVPTPSQAAARAELVRERAALSVYPEVRMADPELVTRVLPSGHNALGPRSAHFRALPESFCAGQALQAHAGLTSHCALFASRRCARASTSRPATRLSRPSWSKRTWLRFASAVEAGAVSRAPRGRRASRGGRSASAPMVRQGRAASVAARADQAVQVGASMRTSSATESQTASRGRTARRGCQGTMAPRATCRFATADGPRVEVRARGCHGSASAAVGVTVRVIAVERGMDISIYDGTRVIHARAPNSLNPS